MKTFYYCADINGWLSCGFLQIEHEFCQKYYDAFLEKIAEKLECKKETIVILNIFKV
jgi:hypothetical protein